MAFSFSSIPHAIASGFTYIAKGAAFLGKELGKVQGTEQEVEAITAQIPVFGAKGVTIERAAYTSLGFVTAALSGAGHLGTDGVAAAEKFFLDQGADAQLIQDFKDLYNAYKADIQGITGAVSSVK